MDNTTTFTLSVLKCSYIVGLPEQVFHFSDFSEYMLTGIKIGLIAAIHTMDIGSHCLQYLFNPKVFCQIDGTKTAIICNSSNVRGKFSLKKIEVSALRLFPVTNKRSAFHPNLILATNIPIMLWDGTDWEKDDSEAVTGSVLTNFFPIYFGQTVVYGNLHI